MILKLFIPFLLFQLQISSNVFCQKIGLCNEVLIDHKGVQLNNDSLRNGVSVFIITSYTCGYCIKSIPLYNDLRKNFPLVSFVGILNNDSSFIEQFKTKYSKEFWFPKIPDTDLKLSKRYWKKTVWPEYHIYNNGKLVKRLVDASDKTYNKLNEILKELQTKN